MIIHISLQNFTTYYMQALTHSMQSFREWMNCTFRLMLMASIYDYDYDAMHCTLDIKIAVY